MLNGLIILWYLFWNFCVYVLLPIVVVVAVFRLLF